MGAALKASVFTERNFSFSTRPNYRTKKNSTKPTERSRKLCFHNPLSFERWIWVETNFLAIRIVGTNSLGFDGSEPFGFAWNVRMCSKRNFGRFCGQAPLATFA